MKTTTKIRTKLLLAFGLISVITVIISGLSIYYMELVGKLSFEVGKKLAPLANAAMESKFLTTRAHLHFEELMSGDEDSNSLKEVQGLIDEATWYCDAILVGGKNDTGEFIPSQDSVVVSLITNAKGKLGLFSQAVNERYRLYKSGSEEAAAGSAGDIRLDASFEEFLRLSDEARARVQASMEEGMKARAAVWESSMAIVGGAGAICAILCMVVALLVSNSIARPIKYLSDVILKISEGDLTQKIRQSTSGDEIGVSLHNLNKMTTNLRDVISNVVRSSEFINNASTEMSSSSQKLSEGATEQASAVEEISSSMEEMVANIQQNTDNAKQTEKIAEAASSEIKSGSDSVDQTVSSMKTIAGKISIIGEIARQTNILALNAAVEAARAGEHGKGFAVVAAEVRKLAERSQAAANEINEVSTTSVEIAQKSGDLLKQIVPNIQRTADLVQEIASASVEQNAGADQINNAIQQLNLVVQQAAATSEELAACSQQLNSQADYMKQLVSFFKIDAKAQSGQPATKQVRKPASNGHDGHENGRAPKPAAKHPSNGKSNGVKLHLNGSGDDLDSNFTRF